MARTIAGAGDVFLLVLILITVPVALIFMFGIPQFPPAVSIALTALTGFILGIINERFVNDIIIIGILSLILFLALTLVVTLGWKTLLLIYITSFIISKKTTEKRTRQEYKIS